jgi:hypothetical protein
MPNRREATSITNDALYWLSDVWSNDETKALEVARQHSVRPPKSDWDERMKHGTTSSTLLYRGR